MAKKKAKQACPHCGNSFINLARHKCKQAPKQAPSARKKELDEKKISTSHIPDNKTLKFISKFIDFENMNLIDLKLKKIIKDILKSSIGFYNFLDEEEADIISDVFKLSTIGDFAEFDIDNIFNTISGSDLKKFEAFQKSFPDLEQDLEKVITISSIIKSIKDKDVDLEKKQHKVIVSGLDKAGKTAILMKFTGNLGMDSLSKLKPTYGVERHEYETENLNLFIWDFGGQESYRKNYLAKPETYFVSVSLILYVIDIQDWERFEESFDYLAKILEIMKNLDENPEIMIFLHKFDPDLRQNPDLLLDVEFVKEVLKDMAEERDFEYDVYLTSIYSTISKEPQFSKFIKTMVDDGSFVANPKADRIEAIAEVLDNTLNSFIKLSESVSRQFEELNNRMNSLERSGPLKTPISSKISSQPSSKIEMHPPPLPPPQKKKIAPKSTRTVIMNELRELFTKNKERTLK